MTAGTPSCVMKLNRVGGHLEFSPFLVHSALHLYVNHLAVDDPRAAELVGDHTEAFGPKRGPEGHGDFAAVGQRVEHALGRSDSVVVERDRHAVDTLIRHARGTIAGIQRTVPL